MMKYKQFYTAKEWQENHDRFVKLINEFNSYQYTKRSDNMNKVVIELEEEYREIVENISNFRILKTSESKLNLFAITQLSKIQHLAIEWFGDADSNSRIKVIERIHSADEIKYIEAKYRYYFKGLIADNGRQMLSKGASYFASGRPLKNIKQEFTEKEFKQVLVYNSNWNENMFNREAVEV